MIERDALCAVPAALVDSQALLSKAAVKAGCGEAPGTKAARAPREAVASGRQPARARERHGRAKAGAAPPHKSGERLVLRLLYNSCTTQ